MSFESPGRGSSPWAASIRPQDVQLEALKRSGVGSIPVALVPVSDGFIRLKNPRAVQAALRAATEKFEHITEVRPFGRGGVLCRSSDETCVADLLKCTIFASLQVSAFIPPHLACVKGIVRGVDVQMTPQEVLEQFSVAGVTSVYRCSRIVEKNRVPTESVIATFVGTTCPSEIKVWPLIYRVEPLSPRPLQCHSCWRFGHTFKACKSSPRCRACGESHSIELCTAQDAKCCLCGAAHPADYSNCPARAQEAQVVEVMCKRRCSRGDAVAIVKERTHGYAGVTAKHSTSLADPAIVSTIVVAVEKAVAKLQQPSLADPAFASVVAAAVEKGVSSVITQLTSSIVECVSRTVVTQLAPYLQPTPLLGPSSPEVIPQVSTAPERPLLSAANLVSDSVKISPTPTTLRESEHLTRAEDGSSSVRGPTADTEYLPPLSPSSDSDMELQAWPMECAHQSSKRSGSPSTEALKVQPKAKSKKGKSVSKTKDHILEAAVAAAGLSES